MDLSEGYTLLSNCLSASTLLGLERTFADSNETNRRSFGQLPDDLSADLHPILKRVEKSLNQRPLHARRIIYFNKTAKHNWFVPWHQDRTIVVEERGEVEGYSNWTVKDGRTHVEPPEALLGNMVTLRIHLDPMTRDNGCLSVLPRSHLHGRIERPALLDLVDNGKPERVTCGMGDIFVMRPLLAHASAKSQTDVSRRILHVELSPDDLPAPLEWALKSA